MVQLMNLRISIHFIYGVLIGSSRFFFLGSVDLYTGPVKVQLETEFVCLQEILGENRSSSTLKCTLYVCGTPTIHLLTSVGVQAEGGGTS